MPHFLKLNKVIIFSLMLGFFQSSLANERIQNRFMDQAIQKKTWALPSVTRQKSTNTWNSLDIEIPLPSSQEKHAEIFDLDKAISPTSNIRFNLHNNHPFYCSLDQLAPSCRRHSDSFLSDSFLNGTTLSGSILFPTTKN